ncbi:MAG: DNA double-strand break repair nuclease NurA [archaeon]|jgi:hypothetical protein
MSQEIYDIVDQMVNGYNRNQVFISRLKTFDIASKVNPYNSEEKLIESIAIDSKINLKVGGVDSGFVSKQLNFANITIIKDYGVYFEYQDGELKDYKYFPFQYNLPKPYLSSSSLELEEIMWNTSILRLGKELDATSLILGQTAPQLLLLDGSIIPQYINKPTKDCPEKKKYTSLISKFQSLYKEARDRKIFLAGCIEDCRASRFFTVLKDEVFQDKSIEFELFDSFLVFSILEENQRTGIFKYSKDPKSHPILADFPEDIRDNLYCCYLKLSNHDYPLRIEFIYFKEFGLSLKNYTEELVKMISSISSFNKTYTYPSVLVEADLRSRLTIQEIDLITNKILEKTRNYGFRVPRRESRLF